MTDVLLHLSLPLKCWFSVNGRKDSFTLNLNNYRNAHYIKLNAAKKAYSDIVQILLIEQKQYGKKIMFPVSLGWTYFHGSRGAIDIANPCSIIDKFTCDALTTHGFWPDDDSKIVKSSMYHWGGVDTKNPRCDLVVLRKS